jgi:hypothetical protein
MTAHDWTTILIAGIGLAVFVATVLAIPRGDASIGRNQRREFQFTEQGLGKGKYPNLLTCDDIMARTVEHHRSY